MQILDLKMNGLGGTIPVGIGELTQLRELNLNGNNFHGTIPEELGDLTELRVLNLGGAVEANRTRYLTGTLPPLGKSLGSLAGSVWVT